MNERATANSSTNLAANSTVKTALLVDDEAALLPIYTEFLERIGYVVAAASNGAEAIDPVKKSLFELVLLDLWMPAKTAFEVLRELGPDHPDACIIMISGCFNDEFAAMALRLGEDSYVTKPCSMGYLADRIKHAQKLRTSLCGLGSEVKAAV